MKANKANITKYAVAGAIGLVTITGAIAYLQYKKMMNYAIKLKGFSLNKIGFSNLDFNIYLNVTNNSNVTFNILSQIYNVYINNTFVTKIENNSPVLILAGQTNLMGLNVVFNPQDVYQKLGKSVLTIAANSDQIIVKVDIKLKVKLWFFTVNIPYTFTSSLKDLMSKKNGSSSNQIA